MMSQAKLARLLTAFLPEILVNGFAEAIYQIGMISYHAYLALVLKKQRL